MKTIAITELTEIEAIIRKCPYCMVGITDLKGILRNSHELRLPGWSNLPALRPRRRQSGNGETASASLYHFLRRTRTGVYAPAGGMQLQHEVAQRDVPRKRPFHRRYGRKREVLDIIMRQYTSDEFKYSEPAVRNVKVWEVKIDKMTCRSFGLRPSEVTSE